MTMNKNNIKAIAIDLDGTILAPGAILTQRTMDIFNACTQKGIKIIIATGRAIESVESYRVALDINGPMIYFNGAIIAEMPKYEILCATMLDMKIADYCIDIARDAGVFCQLYFLEDNCSGKTFSEKQNIKKIELIAEREGKEKEMYYEHTGIKAKLGDLKDVLHSPEHMQCIKTMFMAEPEVQALIRPKLEKQFGANVYIAQTLHNFLEVMDAKASKGKGLKFIMDKLNYKKNEVIACGDEENDLPMFDVAGLSIAPSNAKDSVKAKVNFVVEPNTEDGVALFLQNYLDP
jgi:Cof subfamily protein (haloacid dehalogenase superfamily)